MWLNELKEMSKRLKEQRKLLINKLRLKVRGNWESIGK
jgi:aspartate/tyrosine/aromatic aminotransferase